MSEDEIALARAEGRREGLKEAVFLLRHGSDQRFIFWYEETRKEARWNNWTYAEICAEYLSKLVNEALSIDPE